jgi:hypothetical protein
MDQYKAWDGLGFHDSYMVEQLKHVYQKISQDPINKEDQTVLYKGLTLLPALNNAINK